MGGQPSRLKLTARKHWTTERSKPPGGAPEAHDQLHMPHRAEPKGLEGPKCRGVSRNGLDREHSVSPTSGLRDDCAKQQAGHTPPAEPLEHHDWFGFPPVVVGDEARETDDVAFVNRNLDPATACLAQVSAEGSCGVLAPDGRITVKDSMDVRQLAE